MTTRWGFAASGSGKVCLDLVTGRGKQCCDPVETGSTFDVRVSIEWVKNFSAWDSNSTESSPLGVELDTAAVNEYVLFDSGLQYLLSRMFYSDTRVSATVSVGVEAASSPLFDRNDVNSSHPGWTVYDRRAASLPGGPWTPVGTNQYSYSNLANGVRVTTYAFFSLDHTHPVDPDGLVLFQGSWSAGNPITISKPILGIAWDPITFTEEPNPLLDNVTSVVAKINFDIVSNS